MKIRMAVLEPFNRNLDGQMVGGHPRHPDPESRFVHVSEASAVELENAGLAKRYSTLDEALDARDEDDAGDPALAGTAPGTETSLAVQERRLAGGRAAAKTARAAAAKASAGGQRRKRKGAAAAPPPVPTPVGGRSDNALTNHPEKVLAGDSLDDLANKDPDAAP